MYNNINNNNNNNISSHCSAINEQVPCGKGAKEVPAKGYVAMHCTTNVMQLHAGSIEHYMKVMIRLTE